MKRRYAVVMFALFALFSVAAVRVAIGVPQSTAPSLTLTGQVDIAMSLDGRLLVLVDEELPGQANDGLVEHAFRLENAAPFDFSGRATVTYMRGRLAVQPDAGNGWVFSVAGRVLPSPDADSTTYTVGGIAHSWGDRVHQPPATLFSSYSAASCSRMLSPLGSVAAEQLDGCRNCDMGGPGASSCSINCSGGASCEADCGGGTFACCNCAGGCGCCGATIAGGAHH